MEKFQKKLINSKYGLIFNETCINEGLLPNYTNIKIHDPAARDQYFTKQYRRQLIDFQVTKCKNDIANFTVDIESLSKDLQEKLPTHLKSTVFEKLNELQLNIEAQTSSRITKKLNALYGGQILHKKDINNFINLSSFELSQKQKGLLSLGPKCHYKPKFSSLKKHAELETLYDSILKLQTENIITVTPNLKHLLKPLFYTGKNLFSDGIATTSHWSTSEIFIFCLIGSIK